MIILFVNFSNLPYFFLLHDLYKHLKRQPFSLFFFTVSYYVREIFRKNNLLKDYQENREFDVVSYFGNYKQGPYF